MPEGKTILNVHAGLWERLGRCAHQVSEKSCHLPSGLCGTAEDTWKITSSLCDWEANKSQELSVHVISDFLTRYERSWFVIFLSSDVLVKVAGLCWPHKRVKYSFFAVLWKRLWTIGIISFLNVCEVAWAWGFHWSKHLVEIVAWHFT